MSIPYDLTIAYKTIKSLKLTDLNNSSLKMFVSVLNTAIPDNTSSMHFSAYMLVRGMFRTNPDAFKSYINNTPDYYPLVLWTDYSNILSHFNIQKDVYLGWDSKKNRYCAHFFTKSKPDSITVDNAAVDNPFAKVPTNQELYNKYTFEKDFSKVSSLENNEVFVNMMQRINNINTNIAEKK